MPLPDYIDNDRHKLETVLDTIIQTERQTDLDIATGYFRIEAWMRLEQAFNQLTALRLLIGRDPSILPAERDRIDLIRYFRRHIQGQLESEPFNLSYKDQIDRLIAYLEQNHIQVRLYGAHGEANTFLHAKAYIFDEYSIVGSSNLTPSGLSGNTELNMLNKQRAIAQDLRQNWFSKFWNHPSVDLDYKQKLVDALNASKFGSKPYTPYQVFIKALYELFKEDLGSAGGGRTTLELADFQKEGFERAVRLLERHNACMVADAVGLGKTFIGLRLIEHYLQKERRPDHVPHALVICPAQLRDLVWTKKLREFGILAEVISQEELGRQDFDTRQYNRYDIVVVDESHNFRNSNTNRYDNLKRLLEGGQKNQRVVLLTATPINNGVFDLYHQMLLLAHGDPGYYREWGISNLKSYFVALKNGDVEITELMMQTMVRRSRQDVIKRQQAGEQIVIAGKEIRFPKRQLEQFTYSFEASYQGLYAGIAQQIDQLNLAPYNIKAFKRRLNKDEQAQIKRNEALVYLMKSLWLKRLESSLIAFENSLTAQRNFQSEFEACLHQGKLLDSKTFRKILAAEIDEEEAIDIQEVINSLESVDPKEYDTQQLEAQISADFHALEDILKKLRTIRENVAQGQDHDLKLSAFKEQLLQLKGQKVLVFSYFKDTAQYVYDQLLGDDSWRDAMAVEGREPKIDLITGKVPGKQREEKVKRFAPVANCQSEELSIYQDDATDILICTDVLSEGQNLQDAGVLINYDLHWNPVRMIQRAGRIDRLGTNFEELSIYNCFPEEGLEDLLGLVARLQERIATIDREVGLDASVLGEVISDRSLEELRRLKQAETEAEKQAILSELEQASDLISLDDMRFPLLEFTNQMTQDAVDDIPLGIHSTRTDGPKDRDGVFLAFRARNRHFWHYYPRINGHISTDPAQLVSDKRRIFKLLQCQASDYPNPEELPPVPFDNAIFAVLEAATHNLLQEVKRQQSSSRMRPVLSRLLQKIEAALAEPERIESTSDAGNDEIREQVLRVITTASLRSYEKTIKVFWDQFTASRDLAALVSNLDELFADQGLYHDVEEEKESDWLKVIRQEDIQLVCYQWFKPSE